MISFLVNREHNPLTISAIGDLTPYQIRELYFNIERDDKGKLILDLDEVKTISNKERFETFYRSIGYTPQQIKAEWQKHNGKKKEQ